MRALLLLLSLAACAPSKHYYLDPKFLPLRELVRVDAMRPGFVSTIGTESWCKDPGALLDAYPPGSAYFDALFFHERVHCLHQLQDPSLLLRYTQDAAFRWQEEQDGYSVEIAWRLSHGAPVDEGFYAGALANGYDGMVSREVALAWVQGQVAAARLDAAPEVR